MGPSSAGPSLGDTENTVAELEHRLARELGAAQGWLLAVSAHEVLREVALLCPTMVMTSVLEGVPLACRDVKAVARDAHDAGRVLMANLTLMGVRGCAAIRLGANMAVAPLEDSLCLVAVAREVGEKLTGLCERLNDLPRADEPHLSQVMRACEQREALWHHASDAAQVVAAYLSCHPCVSEVAYPGLKKDPSFTVAARTLQGGFGPLVDYRLRESDTWQRLVCDERDPRVQVMELEQGISCRGKGYQ